MLSRTSLLVIALIPAFVSDASSLGDGAVIRITTWNLEWFPNGSPKRIPAEEQAKRIAAAADVLRPLNSDILFLQEVQDYDACARLAEAIRPHTYQVAICSAFKGGEQQVAILGKEPAQAAWAEPWKSMEGVDPPRGLRVCLVQDRQRKYWRLQLAPEKQFDHAGQQRGRDREEYPKTRSRYRSITESPARYNCYRDLLDKDRDHRRGFQHK